MRNKFILYLYSYIIGIGLIIPNTILGQTTLPWYLTKGEPLSSFRPVSTRRKKRL